ncbi:hypothetical protein I7I50_07578 [Histoplasma capsulatum G186AR]|uniref:Uncharacterized protein n=1 Tax=Ajellomyces capsulatus TaxID=5037 RepID=A0A8H7Z0U8_AJECA|nr:hypothetical protein I7I52_09350 [Histoplasma capsulatum]QSS68235.1 hypothetical protein I7I50_07578 [Histoplasma capsulatum G186AR]
MNIMDIVRFLAFSFGVFIFWWGEKGELNPKLRNWLSINVCFFFHSALEGQQGSRPARLRGI